MAYGEELNNIRGFWWKSGALGGNVKISKVLPFEERNGTFSIQREKFVPHYFERGHFFESVE